MDRGLLIKSITVETRAAWPFETGGLLLGYVPPAASSDVVVTGLVGPGPDAVHLADRFEPDSPWQTDELERAYKASGRRTTYVGDWHSHPHGGAYLSLTDYRTLFRISRDPAARLRRPTMVVAAAEDQEANLRIGCFRLHGIRVAELQLCRFDRGRPPESDDA